MSDNSPVQDPAHQRGATEVMSWLVAVVLLAMAAWFWFGPQASTGEEGDGAEEVSAVDASLLSFAPLRATLSDPPRVLINGFERKCSECHQLFESPEETPRELTQHTHIVLDHGLNDRCFNCHDRKDRNRLVLNVNETISYAEVPRLCARCHGPTYRDWQKGMHGRTNGYWDTQRGDQHRLRCSECHDPHAPAYGIMAPMPGPHTRRMMTTEEHAEIEKLDPLEDVDPLRRWHKDDTKPHPPIEELRPKEEEHPYGRDEPKESGGGH